MWTEKFGGIMSGIEIRNALKNEKEIEIVKKKLCGFQNL